MSSLAAATMRCQPLAAQRHGRAVGGQVALLGRCRPRPASSSTRHQITCSSKQQEAAASSSSSTEQQLDSQRAPLAAAPPAAALEQQQEEQQLELRERWMPASWLSGWKGTGTLLLSFGAVTGGGLMGSGFDIQGPWSQVQALGVLGLTVGIHELGHFLAAVTRGIHVTKFSIGFGPTIFKWQGKEVEYSLRALPLGGFVAFPDDDPESPYPADDPNLLRNRSLGDRTAVISAGVAMNMALALAICIVQASTVGIAEPVYKPGVKLGEIRETSVAGQAGLRKGDILLQIGRLQVAPEPGMVNKVVDAIKDNPGRQLMLRVDRQGEMLSFPITPAPSGSDGSGRIGISLASNAEIMRKKGDNPGQTLKLALEEWTKLTTTVATGLYQFFTNFSSTVENVSGPVAIIAAGAEVARSNSAGLFQFAALVNINLAIVNILPLPALDGGALALAGVEAARGQPFDADVEELIAAASNAFMVLLLIWLVTHDLDWLGSQMLQNAAQQAQQAQQAAGDAAGAGAAPVGALAPALGRWLLVQLAGGQLSPPM